MGSFEWPWGGEEVTLLVFTLELHTGWWRAFLYARCGSDTIARFGGLNLGCVRQAWLATLTVTNYCTVRVILYMQHIEYTVYSACMQRLYLMGIQQGGSCSSWRWVYVQWVFLFRLNGRQQHIFFSARFRWSGGTV